MIDSEGGKWSENMTVDEKDPLRIILRQRQTHLEFCFPYSVSSSLTIFAVLHHVDKLMEL